jgi:Protein of unknown function (DUF2585)
LLLQRKREGVNLIPMGISRKHWLSIIALFALAVVVLLAMHRPPICTCGYIKFWEPQVDGPGNSQHIADWYSFSHMIHGFLFFGLTWLIMRTRPLGVRAAVAVSLELLWEIVENSPMIIDRYRQTTMAAGYSGDSILNSVSDGCWMLIGFMIASRLPWRITIGIAVVFELFTLFMVRDNLTLNVIMLLSPIDAIRDWQAAR